MKMNEISQRKKEFVLEYLSEKPATTLEIAEAMNEVSLCGFVGWLGNDLKAVVKTLVEQGKIHPHKFKYVRNKRVKAFKRA